MDRRTALRSLALGAAGLTFDPERLLWIPGRKTIFIPSTEITYEMLVKTYEAAMDRFQLAYLKANIRDKWPIDSWPAEGAYD